MPSICNVINKCIVVEDSIQVTPKIVSDCIKMLKPIKDYGKMDLSLIICNLVVIDYMYCCL